MLRNESREGQANPKRLRLSWLSRILPKQGNLIYDIKPKLMVAFLITSPFVLFSMRIAEYLASRKGGRGHLDTREERYKAGARPKGRKISIEGSRNRNTFAPASNSYNISLALSRTNLAFQATISTPEGEGIESTQSRKVLGDSRSPQ